jgi:hypothetical protein
MNVRGIAVNLARQNGGTVSREQIDGYFARIKIGTPTNWVLISHNELLFCDKAKFIPAECVNLNAERCGFISGALERLFASADAPYIILRDIREDWFFCLPELPGGINWTHILLQEVLRVKNDICYRPVMPCLSGQTFDTLRSAIVPNGSDIVSFADVVHRYCCTNYKLPLKFAAEDLRLKLRDAGMIEGNELIWNMHKALNDHRFAFDSEKQNVTVLER